MAATLHSGIIPGAEAKKLYSYPTLPADDEKLLLGNGTWGSVYHHPTISETGMHLIEDACEGFFGDISSGHGEITVTLDNDGSGIDIPYFWFDSSGHATMGAVERVEVFHPTVSAVTGKPTANQTPAFGATFTVSQVSRDSLGHVSAITDRTVKIPNSAASSTAAGLMSAADKKNVDSLVSMFNGSWTTSIDASGCMVVKAANGAQIFKIDKAGEW